MYISWRCFPQKFQNKFYEFFISHLLESYLQFFLYKIIKHHLLHILILQILLDEMSVYLNYVNPKFTQLFLNRLNNGISSPDITESFDVKNTACKTISKIRCRQAKNIIFRFNFYSKRTYAPFKRSLFDASSVEYKCFSTWSNRHQSFKVLYTAEDISFPVPDDNCGTLNHCSTLGAVIRTRKRYNVSLPVKSDSNFESQCTTQYYKTYN